MEITYCKIHSEQRKKHTTKEMAVINKKIASGGGQIEKDSAGTASMEKAENL